MDLAFAEPRARKLYTCHQCPKQRRASRHCEEPGLRNLKRTIRVDDKSLAYTFCPGKATWYPEIAQLYLSCRIAQATGIMPREGGLDRQSAAFPDALHQFIERWQERMYGRVWGDIGTFVGKVISSFSKRGSGGGQHTGATPSTTEG